MMPISTEKEILLKSLTELYHQLEELDEALEASFSDIRLNLCNEAFEKIMNPQKKLSALENGYELINQQAAQEAAAPPQKQTLKLELGF